LGDVKMINSITVNLDAVEMMLFFWQSVAEREKVAEAFMWEVAEKEDMKYLYNDNFSKESIRKVLSAISNREMLNNPSKEESRFWNYNMWMLEDMENMNNMVTPVKKLNLDDLKDKLKDTKTDFDKVEVVFIPGHLEEYYIDENKVVINFFKLLVDFMDPTKVNISEKPLKEYVEEKINEALK
jgi:hypothetical protein